MEKTRLGVTISLMGGALYFVGIMGIIPLVILAGYVLLMEGNQWLRRVAIKAVAVVLFFTILSSIVTLVGESSALLNNIVMLFNGTINLGTVNRIIAITRNVITILQVLFLLLLGFKAMKMGDLRLGAVDSTIDKNR